MTLRLLSHVESVAARMKSAAAHTEARFGCRLRSEPFMDDDTRAVVWLTFAADEDILVEWEQAGDGPARRVMSALERVSAELLDLAWGGHGAHAGAAACVWEARRGRIGRATVESPACLRAFSAAR